VSPDEAPRPPKPRPAPQPDFDSAPYWSAAREGHLVVQRCQVCANAQLYGRALCTRCGSAEVVWEPASGRGSVYSYTVIRQQYLRPFRDMVPYVVALVDLEEGPRVMTNIVGCEPDEVTIGMPVTARFEPVSDEASIVLFGPSA
jgi:uncharacterized OB-fold protein